jgi:hypothetical protein
MNSWLHSLPVVLLIAIVFAFVFLLAAATYAIVVGLAVGERATAFGAVSPGLLPPMALVFGLLVGFLAAQVWSDGSSAQAAVDREASALRSAVLLSAAFPGTDGSQIRTLIHRQIREAVTQEWPDMEHQDATLSVVPGPLAAALKLAVALPARSPGQIVAQRDMASSLETAFDARRQRIIISESSVNWAKWAAVIALGVLTLVAIAFVHSGNRRTARIAIGLFAAAMAVSLVMIAVQDRPFSGPFRIKPTVLVQVDPGSTR